MKKALSLLLALAMTASLCACGDKKADTPEIGRASCRERV